MDKKTVEHTDEKLLKMINLRWTKIYEIHRINSNHAAMRKKFKNFITKNNEKLKQLEEEIDKLSDARTTAPTQDEKYPYKKKDNLEDLF